MRHRYSSRRLLLCLVLSHAMALQALLLAWSGAQAATGGSAGAFGVACYGASASGPLGGNEPPVKRAGHQDCLSACLTGHAAATPTEQASLSVSPTVYTRFFVSNETSRLVRSETQVFLARAPPALT